MSNYLADYKEWTKTADFDITFDEAIARYIWNDERFLKFSDAERRKRYLLALGYEVGLPNPASLFGTTDTGWFYDLSDMSTLFQNAAGTTPVTAVGQPVGLSLDTSKGLALGPELVTNGDFSAGSTGWTITGTDATHIATFSGGTLRYQSDTTTPILSVIQPDVLTIGKTYMVEVRTSAWVSGSVKTDSFGSVVLSSGVGVKTFRVVATQTSLGIIRSTSNVDLTIDNISVRELPGNHRSQSVSLNRPTYARHPLGGVRNLLTYTEEFDNAAWSSAATTNVTITQNAAVAPDGSITAARYIAGAGAGVSSGVAFGQQRDATTTGEHRLSVWVRGVGPTVGKAIRLWWWYAGGDAATGIAGTVTPVLTSDWQKITATPSITTTGVAFFRLDTGSSFGSFLAGEEMEIWHPQLEVGSTATPYQRVGSAFDVTEAGQPDLYYLSYDGLNDSLSTSAFAWASDKATVVAGVRKLSDAAIGTLVELSATSVSNNGSFTVLTPDSPQPYSFGSRGTTRVFASALGSYPAPITNVLAGLGDISGDRATLRINGTQASQNTADQGTGNFGTHAAFFGARGGTSLFFNGREYSQFAINRLLTANELSQIERYTAQRTGVTL